MGSQLRKLRQRALAAQPSPRAQVLTLDLPATGGQPGTAKYTITVDPPRGKAFRSDDINITIGGEKFPGLAQPVVRGGEVAYGAGCCWWDSLSKVAQHQNGLPCCPHCGGLLMQTSEHVYLDGAAKHENAGHPGYLLLLMWVRGKCFKTMADARAAFDAALLETFADRAIGLAVASVDEATQALVGAPTEVPDGR